ncbi:hypothetical protein [Methylobacterium nodulans]|uniref:Uncharacterized protein n=1 Tax=Methylobacterium nodulans (strain LMG 21967 / CNCM I-2342 / ORS 2060) TaxID=460265 RepID=B8IM01_METNO|nr:hypothetical protein [Methylobacterium nodulans]ACL56345.1 conserved hypothetical protein [Methylobacterium nodulans ORS 2060]
MTTLLRPAFSPLAAALLFALAASPVLAQPATCGPAHRKMEEAAALRFQARQEARIGDRDRVCDTLGDVEDRYEDARDRFEECGAGLAAIDLRGALRSVRLEKRAFRCD